jgi:hypothetical protein
LLGCPRISPEWELAAMRALIKPQHKGAILHRNGMQKWTRADRSALLRAAAELQSRLGCEMPIHFPAAGDYRFIAEINAVDSDQTRACAAVFSKAVPDLWFAAGRLFAKNGEFYRRQYGYKLFLVPATDVHLPRALRAALRGCL